ncbi:MAG: pilus assembly protein [Marinicaulis sp.]|nr:pilus assembly protein [Marinicaulis sp.]
MAKRVGLASMARKIGVKQALKCDSGMAAVEFALILPMLVFLFFGMLQTSESLTVNRRVSKAANTLSDLTAQLDTISPTQFDNLVTGVLEIMNPSSLTGVTIKVISVVPDPSTGAPIVHWSRDKDGNTPYAAGTDYLDLDDAVVLDVSGSVIVAEIYYPHTLSVANYIFQGPLAFEERSVRWPRSAGITRIQFCTSPGSCTT